MTKDAKTNYDILDLLKKRFSPRAYSSESVKTELINKMLEAARWSPSSRNEQPWRFIVGVKEDKSSETFNIVYNSLFENNQIWCATVPVLIVTCAFKYHEKDGSENKYRFYDSGQVAAHITFQAISDGLYVHQMAGFNKQQISELFKLPEQIEPVTVIAVGHLGNYIDLPEWMQKAELAERERKTLDEIIITH